MYELSELLVTPVVVPVKSKGGRWEAVPAISS
jgi:hypothetical protein